MRVVYVPLTVPILVRILCALPLVLLGVAAGIYSGIGLGEVYGVRADLVFAWTESLANGTVTLDASVDLTGVRVVECVPVPSTEVHVGGLARLCRSSSVVFNDCGATRSDEVPVLPHTPPPAPPDEDGGNATDGGGGGPIAAWADVQRSVGSRTRRLDALYCASPHVARAATALGLVAGVAGIAAFGLTFFDDRTLGPTATFAAACLATSAGLMAMLVADVGTERAARDFDVGGDRPSAYSHHGRYGEGFYMAIAGAVCFAVAAVAGWSAICAEIPVAAGSTLDDDDNDDADAAPRRTDDAAVADVADPGRGLYAVDDSASSTEMGPVGPPAPSETPDPTTAKDATDGGATAVDDAFSERQSPIDERSAVDARPLGSEGVATGGEASDGDDAADDDELANLASGPGAAKRVDDPSAAPRLGASEREVRGAAHPSTPGAASPAAARGGRGGSEAYLTPLDSPAALSPAATLGPRSPEPPTRGEL